MSATKPLNVLYILSDQHNAKCLGHVGHPDVRTPHLDRLAASGRRFRNAITQNPICTPSRVCSLSGQYCHNHGYYGLSGPNPNGLPNIFDHFRNAGYTTAAIGKIHCPEYWVEDSCDVFHETCACSIGGRSQAYANFLRQGGDEAREDHATLRGLDGRGTQTCDGRPSEVTYKESQEGWVAAASIAFMRQAAEQGRPFIIQASLPKPHQTYAPAQEFWDLYDPDQLTLPPSCGGDLEGKAPNLIRTVQHWRSGNWALFEPKTFAAARLRKLRGYLGNISQVDRAVGDLLDFLDASGLTDNTIVVYSSDHGDYACEHDAMEKAPGICSDAITRVPMIWRVPDITPAGSVADELVESVDLSQTFAALCGLPPMQTSDGQDISALLGGDTGEVRRIAVTEFAWSKSVRQGKYRLVYYPRERFPEQYPDGFGELYDLEADPWEMRNLFFQPDCADVVRDLQLELLDWTVTTTRPTTVHGVNTAHHNGAIDDPQQFVRYHCAVNADGKLNPARVGAAVAAGRDSYI